MRARAAVAGAALAVLAVPLLATPARAHGALQTPVSRSVACGIGTAAQKSSDACKAAVSAGADVADWDNIRVANVNGNDRTVIPDGKLCSGGIAKFKGLDLARADWPSTKVTAGGSFTFAYAQKIPHKGTFRIYVTKDGFDATKPLKWADLETKPFLTVTDPAMNGNGAYVMKGALPKNKSGRHIIYAIWQTSSTPDTYYSCADVVFASTTAATTTAGAPAAPPAATSEAAAPSSAEAVPSSSAPAAVEPTLASSSTPTSSHTTLIAIASGVVGMALVASLALFARRRVVARRRG
jgi:predicted carbohydrate-binding protein with CBM5 and CBM33 domain